MRKCLLFLPIWLIFGLFPSTEVDGKGFQLNMISIEGETQGTTYHVKYYDRENRNFKNKIDSILADFDQSLSLYRSDSEISQFNKNESLTIKSPYFYPVLKRSFEIYKATNGAFDPTIMPLTEALGFGPKRMNPELANVDSLLQYVGFDKILFDSKSIKKRKPVCGLI